MRILVTGASGFIGGRFARFALEQGLEVRINGRRAEGVEHLVKRGAQFIPGDLGDAELARRLCQGVDAVVHCAGAVGTWGRYQDFHQGNVVLTENVVEGCIKEHVRRLVHLSSPSIYFTGRSRLDIREDQVPRRFHDHYALTKHLAEQKVFGAQEFGLEVLALRPRFVTGAGDASIFPRLMRMQAKGRVAIVGNGLNKVDFTSVHNLNEALLSALFAEEQALGQAYNISNGHPLPLWDVVNYVMRRMQLPQVTRYRSPSLAYGLAALNEAACMLWPGRPLPTLSRTAVQVMSKDFTLDISRARQYLGYRPQADVWSALDEFCAWWQAQTGQR
ncbi:MULTISPECIES: NAD-dependent epimerase/dehydratase family protein [Pseudomonas]|uniref:NAD(P)-dependent oxidoreductase n=1 Tax=Pseudomonas mosselii TaxID=78327 RepID=A0A7W2JS63_9PSED|nr:MULTISPECIES: NAD(P)-dependent oxidoreductase [Pseudomonas]KXG79686.1 3-beta hydroxysteroid dehydrogenase [Pseudomonas mosselii]MBA6064154.1 NAD(P)-dependent oxidoreductase [Pseudomonas mosselii]MBC3454611.1 NAD(P)-dependent oxidoreductase [Pseudomonas mosselii]MBH3309464.1 NAD(P)-dependent oxidoreductase [Pseudomonas mosselii]MBH3322748.1 NAD(P)-dependent oxidoreductase [Pseudomonas mosselii]